jgi:hypothetical protein
MMNMASRGGRARLATMLVSAALALMACTSGAGQNSPPTGGLTSAQAVAIAEPKAQAMSTGPIVLVTAKSGEYGAFAHTVPAVANRWVWNVIFDGTFEPSGGPAPVPSYNGLPIIPAAPVPVSPVAAQYSVSVVIDYRSGEFISASIPAH